MTTGVAIDSHYTQPRLGPVSRTYRSIVIGAVNIYGGDRQQGEPTLRSRKPSAGSMPRRLESPVTIATGRAGETLGRVFQRNGFASQELPTSVEAAQVFYPVVTPDGRTRECVIVTPGSQGVETRRLSLIPRQPRCVEMGWRTPGYRVIASLSGLTFLTGAHQGLCPHR